MDVYCSFEECYQVRHNLIPKEDGKQKDFHKPDQLISGVEETLFVGSDSINIGQPKILPENATNIDTSHRNCDIEQEVENNSHMTSKMEKEVDSAIACKKYPLRSSNGTRVLRSRLKETSNSSSNNVVVTPICSTTEKQRKRRRKVINRSSDELSTIKRRVKYLSSRMNYEQSLIEAFGGEGWKGQSADRVKPEKELQRATSQISRCKLEMRELFQRLDAICTEGKLHDCLFDSEGQIDCEDIFCAKCGSKDTFANNDIVLCDGVCDRGFHQTCLVPPLLNIPPGDESWFCPGCSCKADCISLLNDMQGTNLSIEDKWEKVFPEVAVASGNKQSDELRLPSDDSEDDDYDPDCVNFDKETQKQSSSSEESNSTSDSDGSTTSGDEKQHVMSGFSSDDSEDDDYNPDAPVLDETVQDEGSSSDESDFSSDTNDLMPSNYEDERSGSDDDYTPKNVEPVQNHTEQIQNSELLPTIHPDQTGDNPLLVSGKRLRDRKDYKKLNDETYGNLPSDSSDDEDWTDLNTPKKAKDGGESKSGLMTSIENCQSIEDAKGVEQSQSNLFDTKFEVVNQTLKPFFLERKFSISLPGFYGREVSQRLCESFKDNAYPTESMLDNLSKELGLTVDQARNWFENTRISFRLPRKKEVRKEENGALKENVLPETVLEPEREAKTVDTKACETDSTFNRVCTAGQTVVEKSEDKGTCQMEISTPNILDKTTLKEPVSKVAAEDVRERVFDNPFKDGTNATTDVKEPESEAMFASSFASNGGKLIKPVNDPTGCISPKLKTRKQAAGTTPQWNSARHESRKRRQAQLEGQSAGGEKTHVKDRH